MTKKKNELLDLKGGDFKEVIKKRLAEKYADDAINLIEDTKRLQKALDKFSDWVEKVEKGDFSVIEKYKKHKSKLEREDDLY